MPTFKRLAARIGKDDAVLVPLQDWRTVLPNTATVGSPLREAKFATNWSDYVAVAGNEVRYYKDPFGVVWITGACRKTGVGLVTDDPILTLPPEYCPAQPHQWMGMMGTRKDGSSVARLAVHPAIYAPAPAVAGQIVLQGWGNTGTAAGVFANDATRPDLVVLEIAFRAADAPNRGIV